MNTYKILHLYPQTMDLYGDRKNLAALAQRIQSAGQAVEIHRQELTDHLDLSGYDLIYLGHGKARNLAEVAKHFLLYKDQALASIESGQVWFVTGNARCLFGRSFTTADGKTQEGLALFPYTGVETNKVFVADMVGAPDFAPDTKAYGFMNRTAYLQWAEENKHPLFRVLTGPGDGNELQAKTEGTHYKNFLATWCMGPMLCRNPILMQHLLALILKGDNVPQDFTLEQQALDLVLAEFKLES